MQTSPQPYTDDVAALRSSDCDGCGVKAWHLHESDCPVMAAALSKPNAPGAENPNGCIVVVSEDHGPDIAAHRYSNEDGGA